MSLHTLSTDKLKGEGRNEREDETAMQTDKGCFIGSIALTTSLHIRLFRPGVALSH